MNRRGFLTACLVAFAAPAIVRAESLMRIRPPEGWETSGMGLLLRGEIGRYENVRIYQQDALPEAGDHLRWEGSEGLTKKHLDDLVATMRRNHVPANEFGDYIAIIPPSLYADARRAGVILPDVQSLIEP